LISDLLINLMKGCDKIYYNFLFIILSVLFFLGSCIPTTAQTKWYKYPGNPVFYPGKVGEWNHTLFQAVIRFDTNKYNKFYTGYAKRMLKSKKTWMPRNLLQWLNYSIQPDLINIKMNYKTGN